MKPIHNSLQERIIVPAEKNNFGITSVYKYLPTNLEYPKLPSILKSDEENYRFIFMNKGNDNYVSSIIVNDRDDIDLLNVIFASQSDQKLKFDWDSPIMKNVLFDSKANQLELSGNEAYMRKGNNQLYIFATK